jgi:hypothetical protein
MLHPGRTTWDGRLSSRADGRLGLSLLLLIEERGDAWVQLCWRRRCPLQLGLLVVGGIGWYQTAAG